MFYRIIFVAVDDRAGTTGYITQNGRLTGE
jgi:hypothetical protein